jgi:hypothetical protein
MRTAQFIIAGQRRGALGSNHRINADLIQRRFASLAQAGYAERYAH